MKRQAICGILALTTCISCYHDIDLESYRGEVTIVLNSIVTPDTVVMADISRTWFFTDSRPAEDFKDLNVELYINSQLKAIMKYNGEKYLSNIYPKEGDTIKISTEVDGKKVVAEDVVPKLIELKNISISHRKVSSGNSSIEVDGNGNVIEKGKENEFTYRITFQDEADWKNYYFIRIEECDNRQVLGTLDYSYEPVFQILSEQINGSLTNQTIEGQFGLPFSDKGIDGKEYTLTIKETGPDTYYDYGDFCYRRFRLYSISEAYYLYLVSLQSNDSDQSWQGGMADIGIAEPVSIYSNIQGGIGILGCQQQVYCLKDIKYLMK